MKQIHNIIVTLAFCCFFIPANADVVLPKVISSNMVLQRDAKVPIWGKADVGETISVNFAGQSISTVADDEGKWSVTLKPLKLNTQAAEMVVAGKNKITLSNILVGDVWLCSGQSNMEYPLDYRLKKYAAPAKGDNVALAELSASKSDQIRYIYAEKQTGTKDIKSVGWITPNDSVLRYVSAVGYFFGKNIYEQTKVPIGIISSSWGGTTIEVWTPTWAYEKSGFFAPFAKEKAFKIDGTEPGSKFESMIQPIVPFAVKGMLWYQGETNCMKEDQATYPEKVKVLIETYRSLFRNPQMPFYYVQIAPYLYSTRTKDSKQHTETLLPEFWVAQEKCLSIRHTGMVVTTDLVDKLSDIHPSYKWIVGNRLAQLALAKEYKKKVEYNGPKYKKMKLKGKEVVLTFDDVAAGLVSADNQSLTWFEVAGKDGVYVSAKAEIKGKKVIVSAEAVANPVNVRFAWNERAQANLFNSAGLPALPFKTGK